MNMKTYLLAFLLISLCLFSCEKTVDKDNRMDDVEFASEQLKLFFEEMPKAIAEEPEQQRLQREKSNRGPLVVPRALRDGKLFMVPSRDWTSGFFPGMLWYMHDLTGDDYWKQNAEKYTAYIEREKTNGGTHDMGFKIYCSFGNGYRITNNESYRDIMIESARTLITRYNDTIGCIRSWDHNNDKWVFPVIIDNMMNLELLFWATKATGDSIFYQIAVDHANTTIKNHFREDNSSFHVIDYDPATGNVLNRHTHQGYAHESAWARGQAWGLYGYTMSYRETGIKEYLEQAQKIADFMINHENMPEDLVPYWDYNAPNIPNEPKDVSAATIMSSALFELSTMVPERSDYYLEMANKILNNVSANYRSEPGTNKGFLLDHSTGHLPGNHEIDVPIIYADYYFLEALIRRDQLKNKELASKN
jgi:unsaturated chondroitin disaccharide hydrolase